MIKKYSPALIIIFFCFLSSFGQTTIYSEDFTGQNGKGAFGPDPIIDVTGVTWNVDITGTSIIEANDWFYVTNEFFEGRDLDGSAIWLSPLIDITGFTNVQFSLDVFENLATDNLEDADTVVIEYRIDAGPWTLAAVNSTYINDFPDSVTSTTGLAGTTIELRVTMTNNGGGERQRIDNILVEGTPPITPTLIVNPNTISGLTYVEGDLSLQEETFTVQGFNLTNDIVLTAPGNFEISTISGGPFSNTINLTPIANEVTLTTIYIRLVSGLTTNTYSGTLTATSIGSTSQNISLNAEVTAPIADCSELLISEYHEGTNGEERYIEIYNPTNSIIDLSNYRLARYVNENKIPNTLALSGNINPYRTYLVSGENSTLCAVNQADFCTPSNVLNFNGDDEIALQTNGGVNIDVIGTIGSAGNFAQNTGLIRNIDVAIPTVVYDASQWSSFVITDTNETGNLGIHASECLCSNTTIWNGTTWSAGLPDSSTSAIINGNYNTSAEDSFISCSLIINSGFTFTIDNGDFIEAENFVLINNGATIITETQGSFVQNGIGTSAGVFKIAPMANASVIKTTAILNSFDDYTYWSSPVADITIIEGLNEANPGRRYTFNANNFLDTDGDGIDDDGNAWSQLGDADIMEAGKGYISMHGIFVLPLSTVGYDYIFEGSYNSGDIIQAVPYNASNARDHWNLLGNPYPSALDTDLFFSTNSTTVDGVLYMWSHVSPADAANPGNEVLNFNQNDYITINTMSTAGNGTTPDPPERRVPSGQSFFISSIAGGDVTFNNDMRVSGNNANEEFFRTSNTNNSDTIERLWINLSSEVGIYSQISIGYADFATDGYDGSHIDTQRNYAGNAGFLYTLDNEGDGFYVIQGKALSSLTEDETIKIGFGALISTNETYTIDAIKWEGDFLSSNTIYLKDKLLNTIHNLNETGYNFSSDGGFFEERFEIVFRQNNALSTDDVILSSKELTIVEQEDDNVEFSINNNTRRITSVSIYDLQGRLVYDLKGDSSKEVFNLSNIESQIYIAKVGLSDGQVISRKVFKK